MGGDASLPSSQQQKKRPLGGFLRNRQADSLRKRSRREYQEELLSLEPSYFFHHVKAGPLTALNFCQKGYFPT